MKCFWIAILLVLAASMACLGQTVTTGDIKTKGICSPVIVQPKGGFEIICRDSTLSKAAAAKQADQVSQILSRLRAQSGNSEQMIKRLDAILKEIQEIKVADAPRHLSVEQKIAFESALQKHRGESMTIRYAIGDNEAARYASEFEPLFVNAGVNLKTELTFFPTPIDGFAMYIK